MSERERVSPSRSQEEAILQSLSPDSLQYLACQGISHNETVPEERRQMFKDLSVNLFEAMSADEKQALVGYIAWKSAKAYAKRVRPPRDELVYF